MPNAVFADLADARHPHIHDAEQRKTGSAIETRCLLVAAALWNRQPSASLSDRSSRAGNSSVGWKEAYICSDLREISLGEKEEEPPTA